MLLYSYSCGMHDRQNVILITYMSNNTINLCTHMHTSTYTHYKRTTPVK